MSIALKTGYDARWKMLGILSLAYLGLTLSWFNIASAFTPMSNDLGISFTEIALLISLFVLGYGITHVPGGVIAARIGMQRTLVLGMVIEGFGTLLSSLATGFWDLAVYRIVAGIGASIFIATSVAAVSVWFRGRELNFAQGVSGGAAFSGGVVLGLYACVYLTDALTWRGMFVVCGVFNMLLAMMLAVWFHTPNDAPELTGLTIDRTALFETVADKQLWIYGIAMIGVYGAYFTASQLLGEYATDARGFSSGQAGVLGAVVAVAGIPGGIYGGRMADRAKSFRTTVIAPFIIMAALLVAIPVVPDVGLWFVASGIGFVFLTAFPAWLSIPTTLANVRSEYLSVAVGMMLTISAVGGFAVPVIFGRTVDTYGYGAGWVVLGAVAAATGVLGLLGAGKAKAVGHARHLGEPMPAGTVASYAER